MSFGKTFIAAFSSAETYRQARLRANYEMFYSFTLVVVSALLLVSYFIALAHGELFTARAGNPAVFDDVLHQIASQTPVMTLQNNQLITREPRSYTIHVHATVFGQTVAGPLATIDTTGATTHENMKTNILITAHDFVFRSKEKTEIHSLADYAKKTSGTLVINRAMADDVAATIIRSVHHHLVKFYLIVGGISWFVFSLVLYVLRMAMVMVLGGIGLLISKLVKVPANYAATVSLAAISYTPVAVADLVLIMGFHRSAPTLALFAGGIAMLTAALIASRDEEA